MALRARALATLALACALALPVAAQEDCSNPADPCPWVVDVDASGFGETSWTLTVDEWYNLTIYNTDDRPHTVSIVEYQVSLTVPADGEVSEVILLDKPGRFAVKDATTGKTATLTVVEDDFVEATEGTTTKGASGPLAAAGLMAFAAAAVAMRRRA